MAGQTYTRLQHGDRCIIHVDDVNSPTGWWWGVVDTNEWKDDYKGGWGSVQAHITGPFAFEPGLGSDKPAYGSLDTKPTVNYTVYPADRETVGIVRHLRGAVEASERKVRDLNTRLDEARGLVKSMGVRPEMIRDAVREALRAAAEAK